MLHFADGTVFASGSVKYTYRSATEREETLRVVIDVVIGNLHTPAFIDTGGVYLMCTPQVAAHLGLYPDDKLSSLRILLRDRWRKGELHRVSLTVLASEGDSVIIDAVAFIPMQDEEWESDLPCILGLQGCLELFRFAVDPVQDMFYFGELA
jgi:hypothetical protein